MPSSSRGSNHRLQNGQSENLTSLTRPGQQASEPRQHAGLMLRMPLKSHCVEQLEGGSRPFRFINYLLPMPRSKGTLIAFQQLL